MRKPLAIGIIGIGFGKNVLLPAFRADARCEVTAFCASDIEKARAAAQATGVPRSYGDWRMLLADPAIDAVAIAVPPNVQVEVAWAAAKAGKHLFCEKPLALNLDQANAILTAAARNKLAHAIDFEFPEVDAWPKTKASLAAGTLGRIRHVALTWRIETYAHRAQVDTWKIRAEVGGGTLNNFSSHTFYYLEWLFGPLTRLAARLSPSAAADARVDWWGEFSAGFPVTVSIAADAFLGPGHRLEVYGDQGTLVLENRGSDYMRGFSLSVGTRQTGTLIVQETLAGDATVDGRIAPVSRIARRFLDAIDSGQSVTPGLREGTRVQQLIDAARASHRSKTWQEVAP
ncbi:MAG: Gfo/Idh/MocA family oxidoreductase [Verrucomicrobia bacterium]|nr:Gfo/Idh/MocA family oxidoreductase [Verrucomicrobiota bacterium]